MTRGWLAEQPPTLQQAILRRGHLRRLSAGALVFQAGDQPDGLYAVVTGQMKLVYHLPEGRAVVLWAADPGFWFGVRDLFAGQAVRYGAAMAASASHVFHLPIKEFQRIVSDDPRYTGNFAMIMSHNFLLALRYISEILSQPAPGRVARMLALLCDTAGTDERGGYELKISQEDLAGMLSLSRVTVGKALRALQSDGLIALQYGRIAIPDSAKLARR
jgi:CRP-like cAMP-binding protein